MNASLDVCRSATTAHGTRPPDGPVAGPLAHIPLILALDRLGTPLRWITWQHACVYHARGMVAWSAGERAFTVHGGLSRQTGARSEISSHSILAISGLPARRGDLRDTPPLSNRELFRRDRHLCAYCGRDYAPARLTRDHIVPVSRGGADQWMNVVTACRPCNQRKGGRTPERARMLLLYAPYVPSRAEFLILCNRAILADQMDFLAAHLPAASRVRPLGGAADPGA